jgi:glyoxylase-like metal-dependent hydrolase (beta-lactamase superfamily II)
MLQIHTLPLGAYQTNTYIVYEEGSNSCAVIDPGYEAKVILNKVSQLGLTVDAILLTHGHFDHVGAVLEIQKATSCAIWMNQGDYSPARHPMRGMMYPLADTTDAEINLCEEGEQIHAGGLTFTTLETPGHTWGSVCYLCGDALFSGDTLFAGSCGRTDLPGGDWATITQSLHRLKEIEANLRVFPGHGEGSTLNTEKTTNPYLR